MDEIEQCRGQLEIPWDLEDHHKIYRGWSRPANNHLYRHPQTYPKPLTVSKGLIRVPDAESPSTR